MGRSASPKIWFRTAPSSPTNTHRKLDVSLLPSTRKIGLPRHRFQTRAFVVIWGPHKSITSRHLCLHLHSLATPSLLQLQILVPRPPYTLSSHPLCHPTLDARHHRNSSLTPSLLSSRTLSHTFLNPSRSRIWIRSPSSIAGPLTAEGPPSIAVHARSGPPMLAPVMAEPQHHHWRPPHQISYPFVDASRSTSATRMTRGRCRRRSVARNRKRYPNSF